MPALPPTPPKPIFTILACSPFSIANVFLWWRLKPSCCYGMANEWGSKRKQTLAHCEEGWHTMRAEKDFLEQKYLEKRLCETPPPRKSNRYEERKLGRRKLYFNGQDLDFVHAPYHVNYITMSSVVSPVSCSLGRPRVLLMIWSQIQRHIYYLKGRPWYYLLVDIFLQHWTNFFFSSTLW